MSDVNVEQVDVVGSTGKAKRSRRNFAITQEEFVDLLVGSRSVQEVADKWTALERERGNLSEAESVEKGLVTARATTLRKKGVNLPKMRARTSRKTDVGALNARIASANVSN